MKCFNVQRRRNPILEINGIMSFEILNFYSSVIQCEYDGRDVLVSFIGESQKKISLFEKLEVLCSLLDETSNFKSCLFNAYSYLKCKKRLEYMFFKPHICLEEIIEIDNSSDPTKLVQQYYRECGYLVLDSDDEEKILKRHKDLVELYIYLYRIFLKSSIYSEVEAKYEKNFAFDEKEKLVLKLKKEKEFKEKFSDFVSNFELGDVSSSEAKELLYLYKKYRPF